MLTHESCPNTGLLQTTWPCKARKLSEHRATSDNFALLSTKTVRTQSYFRQLFLVKHESCPNTEILQTTWPCKARKLSEHRDTSDNFALLSTKAVRTQRYFRQLGLVIPKSCPNTRLLQTTFPCKARKLSEH